MPTDISSPQPSGISVPLSGWTNHVFPGHGAKARVCLHHCEKSLEVAWRKVKVKVKLAHERKVVEADRV
jgi:hypothetical protein